MLGDQLVGAMPELASDLAGLLQANEVPEAVRTWMSQNGAHSMKLFANFADQAAEIKGEIMDKTTLGGNRSALSALKQS